MAKIQVILNRTATGTNTDDLILGTTGNDVINANGGNDIVYGFAGNDTINGGLGNDLLFGGLGNDIIHGNEGQDFLYGEDGSDTLYGDAGNDYLDGGIGNDLLTGGQGNDLMNAGEGVDTIVFSGKSSEYLILSNTDGSAIVIDLKSSRDGIDVIYNAELLKFSNTTITIKATNAAPVTTDVSATGLEDAAVIPITLKGTDDGSVASFSLSSLPANGTLYTDSAHTHAVALSTAYNATNNQLTLYFVPNANFNGDVSFNYAAKDNAGLVDTTPAVATIHVTAVNDAPIVQNPIADLSINEDASFSYTVPNNTFFDVDSTLTLSAKLENGSALPSWLTFNPATKTFSGTPDDANVGAINIKITASDGQLSVSDIFTLTVNPVNDAPVVAHPIADQVTNEDASFNFTVPSNTFTDQDGDPLTLTASLQDGSALPSWLTFNPATNTFSGTPEDVNIGSLAIKVTASDGHVSTSDIFTLTVNSVNDAPVVANPIADQVTAEDSSLHFTLPSDTFSDQDTDNLTLSATLEDGSALPSWLSFNGKTFTGTPDDPNIGSINIKVTASDGQASVSDIFTLTVQNVEEAPILTNPIGLVSATEDAAFSFTIPNNTIVDPDPGDHLSYDALVFDPNDPNYTPIAFPNWLTFDANTGVFSGIPSNADVGNVFIKLTATDTSGLSAYDVFAINVVNTNDSPILANPIADQVTAEDSPLHFTIPSDTFSDPDNDDLTLTATLEDGSALPSWLTFNGKSFNGTPDDPDIGSINVKVTASDGQAAVSDVFTLTVNPVNDAPVVNSPITDRVVAEDHILTIKTTHTFADQDVGDTLNYVATLADGSALPAWLTFNSQNEFVGMPTTDADAGTITVRLTATDSGGLSATDEFTITVNPVNDAPVLNAITDTTFIEDGFNAIQFNDISDEEGDAITYTATLADGTDLPSWLTFDPTGLGTGKPMFSATPDDAQVGTISIKLIASDARGATSSDIFDLTVQNVEEAPVLTNPIGAVTATEDGAFSFTIPNNTIIDPDPGDHLTYSAIVFDPNDPDLTPIPFPTWLTFDANTGTFSGTPANEDVGDVFIQLTATDSSGLSASDIFSIAVQNVNDTPVVINPIADQTILEDVPFSLQVGSAFSDPDVGDHKNLTATLENGSPLPHWLDFNGKSFSGTPANRDVGTINIKVTDTDDSGASVSDVFTITVQNVNDAPTVSAPIPDQVTPEDSPFSHTLVDGTFFDPDRGDSLTYSALLADGSALPSWLHFDAQTQTFSGTPSLPTDQPYAIKITATDSSGLSVSDTFNLTVSPVNDEPIASQIPDQVIDEDALFSLNLANYISDQDNDPLTYEVTLIDGPLPAWLSIDPNTGILSGTPDQLDVGRMGIKVVATDPSGAYTSTDFSLIVNEVNDSPILERDLTDTSTTAGSPFSLDLPRNMFTDEEDGSNLTYSATLSDGSALPGWLLFDPQTNSLRGTPSNADAGDITIKITATDSGGASASDLFNLAVMGTLFTEANDTVDFNMVVAGQYVPGTQYNALGGNDVVILPTDAAAAQQAGYDPAMTFLGG